MNSTVFCLMGPTAIGKTDLACLLTESFPFELVNVDSSLIYRELNIGAAKPSLDVLAKYPHHLIDVCDLNQVYTVADYCVAAETICQDIIARNRIPLLVGGSMMYFHAFQHGLAKLPDACMVTRQKLHQEILQFGALKLHQELLNFDPETAARIHPNDSQRLIRAHEIYRLSGKSWSELLAKAKVGKKFEFINLAILPEPRAWLHERIALRFEQMMAFGLVDECAAIKQNYPDKLKHPALRSVGYRQVLQYLAGDFGIECCLEKGIAATRQLAKRQMTWIRSMAVAKTFLQPNQKILQEMIAVIQEILDNEALIFSKNE